MHSAGGHRAKGALGSAEAKLVVEMGQPELTSKHFIMQYVHSFNDDPVMKDVAKGHSGTIR